MFFIMSNVVLFLLFLVYFTIFTKEVLSTTPIRIVGGDKAPIKVYPWQAAIISSFNALECGGSIIGDRFVLTAAHCCAAPGAMTFKVRLGSPHYNTGGQVFDIIKETKHPKYNSTTQANDVCVCELKEKIKFDGTKQPIKIYKGPVPSNGTNLYVTGFGMPRYATSTPTKNLKRVVVPYVPYEDCIKTYQDKIDNSSMICAGSPNHDACQGDSGGPLCNENNELVGAVSWGTDCGVNPGVYAYIPAFESFIYETMDEAAKIRKTKLMKEYEDFKKFEDFQRFKKFKKIRNKFIH